MRKCNKRFDARVALDGRSGYSCLRDEMKQFSAKVTTNRKIAEGYFEMRFGWPASDEQPVPGQFISIKTFGTTDLVLRRPFAVSAYDPRTATAAIIYQKRGKATTMLAATTSGDELDMIGPLGNRFPEPAGEAPVLVGGGVGLGPILFFGNHLSASGKRPTLVLGFRTAALIPKGLADADLAGLEAVICTDDGSVGFHGTTVDWLRSSASAQPDRFADAVVHACGPNAMMAECDRFCSDHRLRCWVSMEQVMGCGVGACIGCAIPVSGEERFARVCTDGPVFDSRIVRWEQME